MRTPSTGLRRRQPVPGPLQDAFELLLGIHQTGHFVEDDDAGGVVGQGRCQQPERGVPVRRVGGGGEVEVRHLRVVDEPLDQSGLADPPPPSDEQAAAGPVVR
ncbi:hypothetical protein O7623_20290 [Solwaraspora sp. WMMD791]|uniref:hypothetical protein n=1 Tax=Solwaraspora sp. WMMD791 TaxID=3016086 RepID=UPI00249BF60C|nr:hypothetical protein [Solwaraspora sp. WMMD791]WFE25701.1 hypothetical protein O7623_20290 [Solwaraspora sp. WMMD791]